MQRQQLEELYSAHSGSMSILMAAGDEDAHDHNREFPEGPANFTLLWYIGGCSGQLSRLLTRQWFLSSPQHDGLEFVWMLQEVQPRDEREGVEVALPKS